MANMTDHCLAPGGQVSFAHMVGQNQGGLYLMKQFRNLLIVALGCSSLLLGTVEVV